MTGDPTMELYHLPSPAWNRRLRWFYKQLPQNRDMPSAPFRNSWNGAPTSFSPPGGET